MIIRIILISLIIGAIGWFLNSRTTSKIRAVKKIGIIIFAFFAVISVIFPALTDGVAHSVGVGRGADLLLYLLAVAFITFVLNQYMRSKDDEQRINRLARKIAILEANQHKKDK